jgi:hypothetical protein
MVSTSAAALALPTWLRSRSVQAALPIPSSASIGCRVMRKGSDIGLASYKFDHQGDKLVVQIAIDLLVKVGPIGVFRYTHRNVETWQGDTLIGYDSKTDDDGVAKFMSAKRGPSGLMVTGSKTQPYTAPANALGTTYWNIACVSVPLINTEDGHLMNEKVTPVGTNEVPLASGTKVKAQQYAMVGDVKIDLWYEITNAFASMRYYAKDGSVVTYARL